MKVYNLQQLLDNYRWALWSFTFNNVIVVKPTKCKVAFTYLLSSGWKRSYWYEKV